MFYVFVLCDYHQYHGVLVRWRCSCGDTFTCKCPFLVLNKVYYYYYYSTGRIHRHSAVRDVVRCGLSAAGILFMHEPSGIDCVDGKRLDGITAKPCSQGRSPNWDAKCVNILDSFKLTRATLAAGCVADTAEVRKIAKFAMLGGRFILQPIALETSGAKVCRRSIFYNLGHPLVVRLLDQRE